MTTSKTMLTIGLFLKYSKLHMAKYPNNRVNITFCLGNNKLLPFIKLNGISDRTANTKRLIPYCFLFLVFSKPSTSRKAKIGKAKRPNINMTCSKETDLPATVNHTVLAHEN